jgi:hypothetical protein
MMMISSSSHNSSSFIGSRSSSHRRSHLRTDSEDNCVISSESTNDSATAKKGSDRKRKTRIVFVRSSRSSANRNDFRCLFCCCCCCDDDDDDTDVEEADFGREKGNMTRALLRAACTITIASACFGTNVVSAIGHVEESNSNNDEQYRFIATPATRIMTERESCGTFTKERLKVAREILTCNQEQGDTNWHQACLQNYTNDVEYVDGPGLTHVFSKEQMRQYLKNQFDFSRQWLTVETEICENDSYVAEWKLAMDLGIGSFRDLPGVTVLRFDEGQKEKNLVKYHRDYLPDGNIVERQPVVGNLVKYQRETYTKCMASKEGCVGLLGGPK